MTGIEPAESETEERLLTGYSGRLSLTFAVGFVAVNLGRQVLPPFLPSIIGDLGITPAQAGVALTLLSGGHAIVQYPGGRLTDEFSRKTVLVAGLGVAIAGLVLLSVSPNYLLFVAGTALLGLGRGAYIIAMRVSLSDLFVERRGQALGINTASGQVGSVMAAGLAVVVLAVATWRAAFLPIVALVVLVVAAIEAWSHDSYAVSGVELRFRETVGRVLATRQIRWLLVAYTLVIFTWQGVVGFLPTLLQVDKEMTPALAGAGFALLFVVAMVVQPLAGGLSDRLPRTVVAGGALVLGAAGLAGLWIGSSRAVLAVSIVLLAIGLMAFPPVTQAYLLDVFPDSSVGGDFGAFRTIYQVIASLGPTYVGLVAERASYTAAFAGFGLCMLASAAILLLVMDAE